MNYSLDLGTLGKFDFSKARKITIKKELDCADKVIAEFTTDKAEFIKVDDADLIIKIDNRSYYVTEIKEGEVNGS